MPASLFLTSAPRPIPTGEYGNWLRSLARSDQGSTQIVKMLIVKVASRLEVDMFERTKIDRQRKKIVRHDRRHLEVRCPPVP